MKSRITIAISTGLLLPIFVLAPVLAVEDDTQTNTTTQTVDDKKAALQERLKTRKDALKTKLTALQEKRIETRCKNSQGLVKNLQAKINGTETSRNQVYSNLVDRLNDLEGKLVAAGADTTELKTQLTELQVLIDTFKTDLATYKQTIADLVEMDCVADPAAFKASLEEARTQLTKVRENGVAIKTYVNDTIKPTLKNIRASLETTDTTTTETN